MSHEVRDDLGTEIHEECFSIYVGIKIGNITLDIPKLYSFEAKGEAKP